VVDTQFYLETNLKKEKIEISEIERKDVLASHKCSNIFILYTISLLSRSCLFIKGIENNPYSSDDLNYIPDSEELALLQSYQNDQWWINCESKVARNSVAKMF